MHVNHATTDASRFGKDQSTVQRGRQKAAIGQSSALVTARNGIMECGNCQQFLPPLTETFEDSANNRSELFVPPSQIILCRSCIIGKIVPAYRSSLKRWNLGLVVAYRPETQEFCLLFEYTVREWLTLDKAPFEAYAAYHRHCRLSFSHQDQQHRHSNAVSFDELWPSDDLSWTSGNHHHHQGSGPSHERRDSTSYVPIAIDITRDLSSALNSPVLTAVDNTHHYVPMMSPIPLATTITDAKKPSLCELGGGYQLKSTPRHWSDVEDLQLLRAVSQTPKPIRWAQVALLVPNRSGKMCRERFVNHLHTKLKSSGWTPLEDATICRLYKTVGSRWIEISRLVPGRSDNSCKNRWHYLRRHLEKYVANSPRDMEKGLSIPLKAKLLKASRAGDELDGMEKTIAKALIHLADTLPAGAILPLPEYAYAFGPFEHLQGHVLCVRCGLVASSAQTGPICQTSKWCWACSQTPAVLYDDFLRLEHQLRANDSRHVSRGAEE